MMCQGIQIEIDGDHEAEWMRHWTTRHRRTRGHGKNRRVYYVTKHHKQLMKKKGSLLSYKAMVYMFPAGQCLAGNYAIQFSFKLPDDLPSSFAYRDTSIREKPKCKIDYDLKANFIGCDCGNVSYKLNLNIRENIPQTLATQKEETTKVSGYCEGATPSNIKVQFQKTVYMPNEIATCAIAVDNTQCKKMLTNMKMAIRQTFRIRIGGHAYTKTFELLSQTCPGCTPGTTMQDNISLNLAEIKSVRQGEKMEKDAAGDAESAYYKDSIMPRVGSSKTFISNDYNLVVTPNFQDTYCYDGCMLGIPMVIVPQADPATFGFIPPEGWSPVILANVMFQVDS
jgi:hypothetical protein